MKIALINGPSQDGSLFMREGRCTQQSAIWSTQWPPISLAYLSALAGRMEHQSRVYDCPASNITLPKLRGLLRSFQPDLCLIAFSTPSLEVDMALARILRQTLPATRLGAFGVHVTVQDRQTLADCPALDFVIRSEPEETFTALVRALGSREPWWEKRGITVRREKTLNQNPDRPFIRDLDLLPFPAWDRLDLDAYRMPFRKERFLTLTPFRGCPYRCSFCTAAAYYGHAARYRSIGSVIDEIVHERGTLGIDDFFMWTETFTLNKAFVMNLCREMASRAPGIRWTCNSRADTVDEEMLVAMGKAGCWMVGFGFESTDPTVLEKMNKNLRTIDYSTPLRQARKAGLSTLGHFILGMPGETPDSMNRTIRDALCLDLDFIQFYTAAPLVGSPLYDDAKEKGCLEGVAYDSIGQSSATLSLPGLPAVRVDRARRKALLRFYLRPRQVARVIRFAGWGLFRQLARLVGRRWLPV